MFICMKMDLALNNLQRLICHEYKQTNKQTNLTFLPGYDVTQAQLRSFFQAAVVSILLYACTT